MKFGSCEREINHIQEGKCLKLEADKHKNL